MHRPHDHRFRRANKHSFLQRLNLLPSAMPGSRATIWYPGPRRNPVRQHHQATAGFSQKTILWRLQDLRQFAQRILEQYLSQSCADLGNFFVISAGATPLLQAHYHHLALSLRAASSMEMCPSHWTAQWTQRVGTHQRSLRDQGLFGTLVADSFCCRNSLAASTCSLLVFSLLPSCRLWSNCEARTGSVKTLTPDLEDETLRARRCFLAGCSGGATRWHSSIFSTSCRRSRWFHRNAKTQGVHGVSEGFLESFGSISSLALSLLAPSKLFELALFGMLTCVSLPAHSPVDCKGGCLPRGGAAVCDSSMFSSATSSTAAISSSNRLGTTEQWVPASLWASSWTCSSAAISMTWLPCTNCCVQNVMSLYLAHLHGMQLHKPYQTYSRFSLLQKHAKAKQP